MTFKMTPKHKLLQGIWDKWHGIGQFPNSEGGIEGQNKACSSSKWCKHLNAQHYSRTSHVIDAIKAYTKQHSVDASAACKAMNPWYLECKMSVGNMVAKCQEEGLIPKKVQRGRKKSPPSSPFSTDEE
jgi:hypothetical protein